MFKTKLTLAIFISLIFGMSLSSAARAESFTINPTNGYLNLGFAFKNKEVLPAPASIGPTNLPDLWAARDTITLPGQPGVDPSSFKPAGCLTPVTFTVTWAGAPGTPVPNDGQSGRPGPTLNSSYPCPGNPQSGSISGDVNYRGVVEVQANDFRFPIMVVPSPLDGSPVPITLAATGALAGNFNNQTGGLTLSGPIEARVLVGLSTNPLGQYCAVPLPGVELGTGTSTPATVGFVGTPFANGLDSNGALTGTWSIVDDSTPIGGADCSRVNSAIKGSGGLWLGAGISTPTPYPECPAGTLGLWPDCVPEPSVDVGSVKVAFVKKKVRAGAKARLRVSVTNKGSGSGDVLVKLSGNRKKLSYPGSVSLNVGPNATETKTIVIKVRKNTRSGARIWANTNSLSSSSGIQIKK